MAFEKEFAARLEAGSPPLTDKVRTLSVNSATSGLHLALEAVGVGPGKHVAVPSLTFTATAEIVRYLGADPVFIDSDPATGNIDPTQLSRALIEAEASGKTIDAVIPVHLAGHPCDISAIRKMISGRDTAIIEDAAHAFPSLTANGMAGTLGDIGVFSFYATKTITTGEGGMIATRNSGYEERMKLMRLHGIDRVVWNRYGEDAGGRSWEYDVTAPGFKYNLPDLAAAVGREQLKKADKLLGQRRNLAQRYMENLAGLKGLVLPGDCPGHAWHLFIIKLNDSEQRNHLADELGNQGIGSSVHFIPLHKMTYWKEQYDLNAADYPVAEDLAGRSLSLPLWPGLSRRNQDRVIDNVRRCIDG